MSPVACGCRRAAAAMLVLFALAGAARPEDFYRGKTLTFLIGFAPGGGVDAGGRLIARHLPEHIPGTPAIVVQNMPGAAGLVCANHVYAIAKGDGLTLAVPGREWPMARAMEEPGARFDPLKFAWIGSSGPINSIAWVRTDTGVHGLDELRRRSQEIVVGALARSTPTASVPLLLAADGFPFRVVPGYDGSARILLALEAGEVSAAFVQESSFARRHDLIDSGAVLPLLQMEPHKPGVPLVRDVVPPAQRPLLAALAASTSFGLPLVGPPGIPEERIQILRRAFMDMAADPAFIADAETMNEPVGHAIEGGELASRIAEVVGYATPEVVAAYKKLTAGK